MRTQLAEYSVEQVTEGFVYNEFEGHVAQVTAGRAVTTA